MLASKIPPSAWQCRKQTRALFQFLVKAKLSLSQPNWLVVDTFVRRHKSRFDTASNKVDD